MSDSCAYCLQAALPTCWPGQVRGGGEQTAISLWRASGRFCWLPQNVGKSATASSVPGSRKSIPGSTGAAWLQSLAPSFFIPKRKPKQCYTLKECVQKLGSFSLHMWVLHLTFMFGELFSTCLCVFAHSASKLQQLQVSLFWNAEFQLNELYIHFYIHSVLTCLKGTFLLVTVWCQHLFTQNMFSSTLQVLGPVYTRHFFLISYLFQGFCL